MGQQSDLAADPPASVAVVIPCYNEETTVARVVSGFRLCLPDARVYVVDNNSTDATAARAREAGATVIREKRQGKGYAVQRMFESVDADIYVMADGDDTYPPENAGRLVAEIAAKRADMAVGNRSDSLPASEMTLVRRFGNWMIPALFNRLFGTRLRDVLSGYRAMSRDFVRNVPLLSRGFEVETELVVQALHLGYQVREVPIDYRERPEGSHSKLHALKDGSRILCTMAVLWANSRPLLAAGLLSCLSVVVGLLVWAYAPGGRGKAFAVFGLSGLAVALPLVGFVLAFANRRLRELHAVLRRREPEPQ